MASIVHRLSVAIALRARLKEAQNIECANDTDDNAVVVDYKQSMNLTIQKVVDCCADRRLRPDEYRQRVRTNGETVGRDANHHYRNR